VSECKPLDDGSISGAARASSAAQQTSAARRLGRGGGAHGSGGGAARESLLTEASAAPLSNPSLASEASKSSLSSNVSFARSIRGAPSESSIASQRRVNADAAAGRPPLKHRELNGRAWLLLSSRHRHAFGTGASCVTRHPMTWRATSARPIARHFIDTRFVPSFLELHGIL